MLPPREDRRKRPRLDEPTASSSVLSFLRRDFSSRFYASTTRETATVTPRDNNQLQPSETDLTTHNDTDTCTGLVHRVAAMGVNDHANELLVRVAQTAAATANVVFFPGDVQDDTDAMSSGAYAEYAAYSYESTAELLADKFGDDTNVWIVRPSRFQYGTYTCFDHFVESNRFGAVATYLPTGSAVEQLTSLMEDARTRLAEDHNLGISTLLPVHLVGFSKGGVVLNQIATEIASRWHPSTFDDTKLHADDDDEPDDNNARDGDQEMAPSPRTQLTHQFAALVSSMHWLDSGNGSKEGAVPTDEATLAGLSTIPSLQLHVHVTPYQFDAVDRPWIKKEVLRFIGAMKRLGVVVRLQRYFEDTAVSLATHFQILRDFQLSSTTVYHKSGQTHSPEVAVQPYPIQTHA